MGEVMKTRIDVIKHIIEVKGYKSYLEIGCQDNVCFNEIQAERKVGVDPRSGGTHRMTSDDFFARTEERFDLIFIDGDHSHGQVVRDMFNAGVHLKAGGCIVMHDCLPPDRDHESPSLCGTVWRAFAYHRSWGWLDAVTADFDYGVGIIFVRRNSDPISLPLCSLDDLNYTYFTENRERWMRPRTAEQVKAFVQG